MYTVYIDTNNHFGFFPCLVVLLMVTFTGFIVKENVAQDITHHSKVPWL
jgi:hypothetical protein